jgi:3-mercaptopyruvate sulfurtransferase SseA
MMRRVRLRRITPAMLHRKLQSNSKVAVLDLVSFEEETDGESVEAIPGAFRVDPSRLRRSHESLFRMMSNSFSIRAVAVAFNRIGVDKVWVLDGGVKAWREQGFPVSQSLEVPEVVAERLGVKLPDRGRLDC